VLRDRHPVGGEEHRQRLDLLGCGGLAVVERVGREEVLVGEEVDVGVVAGADHAGGAQPGQRDLLAGPLPVGEGDAVQLAADVVEGGEQEPLAGAADAAERDPLRRLEQHRERPVAAQQVVEGDGEQRPLAVGRAAHRPVGAQRDERLLLPDAAQLRVERDVDLDQAAVEPEEGLRLKERGRP
jgi:hypothetical protein